MKRAIIISAVCIANAVMAEMINVNPDPNGEPWIAGGVPPLTAEGKRVRDAIPEFQVAPGFRNRALPKAVDNSEKKFFRPIFNQEGNSCAQASGIGYIFTYEMSRIRDLDAQSQANWYPSHFTWHYINGAENWGSWPWWGWQVVEKLGCPTYADFGGMNGGDAGWTKWLSGYDAYYNGMKQKITEQVTIENCNTMTGVEKVKQFMYDYGSGESAGGIVSFSALSSGVSASTLPSGSAFSGEDCVTKWGTGGAHMMTFVGYNDDVKYDINNDGQFTTDQDVNNDGRVDLNDCEIGAFKVANSWGTNWHNSGFTWMPYFVLGNGSQNAGGIANNEVYSILTKECDITHTLRVNMTYNHRFNLTLTVGVAQDAAATAPTKTMEIPIGKPVSYDATSQVPMQGKGKTDPIEMGIDITELLEGIHTDDEYKIFLQCNGSGGTGEVTELTLIDYNDAEKEYSYEGSAVSLSSGTEMISFVKSGSGSADTKAPALQASRGTTGFVGDELPVEIDLYDKSGISSVSMSLSIDGKTTTVHMQKVKTEGKVHTYKGTVPAQAELSTTAKVTATDEYDNSADLDLALSWNKVITLKYDDEANQNLGNGNGDTFILAVKYGVDELQSLYDGGLIEAVHYYISDNDNPASAITKLDIHVYKGTGNTPGTKVYSESIKSEVKYGEWSKHTLKEKITLEDGNNYWVGYDVTFTGGYFCSYDENKVLTGKSNIVNWNGEWSDLTALGWGVDGAWNIRADITKDTFAPVSKVVDLKAAQAVQLQQGVGSLNLKINAVSTGVYSFSIYDLLGRQINSHSFSVPQKGAIVTPVATANQMATCVYLYSVKAPDGSVQWGKVSLK